jgi:hypothetical protein
VEAKHTSQTVNPECREYSPSNREHDPVDSRGVVEQQRHRSARVNDGAVLYKRYTRQ